MSDLSGLETFWRDFDSLGRDVNYFVTARLLEGRPSVWPEELDYVRWRHLVATTIGIDPMSIQLVGSARLGYSLNPKKDFKKFDHRSDLDIAIVSSELFNSAWGELRDIIDNRPLRSDRGYLQKLVFEECIALDIALPHLTFGEYWSKSRDLFTENLGDPLLNCSINYRIYRNHRSLRNYQSKSVRIARDRAIEEGIGHA